MAVQVFVSSTFNDLKHHRAKAIAQLRGAGLHVDPMEDWPADAEEPTKFCPERVEPCQLCVLLIAFRRGWVPPGATLSITQQELAKAEALGIPVLPFLLHEDVTGWGHDERTTDAQVNEWRKVWRSKAGSERFHFDGDPRSLDVMPAVTRWLNTQHERELQRQQRERIRDYLDQIQTAHGKIKFLGLPTLKESPNKQGKADNDIADLFVEPALAADFISPDTTPEDWKQHAPLRQAVATHRHLVVLGDPGTGKSTLVNWIAWNLAARRTNPWKSELGELVPLPFVLRDLEIGREITWDGLLDKFLERSAHDLLTREHLATLLRSGNAILLLDGLDEIGDQKTREKLCEALCQGREGDAKACRWLLTSRIAGYDELTLESPDLGMLGDIRPGVMKEKRFTRQYVVPFDDHRITEFAGKWYKAREEDRHKAEREATSLTKAIHRDGSTLRLARVPNLLTIMALVYRIESDLPHGKANLYDKIATAYLETIDKYYRLALGEDSLSEKKSWLGLLAFRMQQNRVRAKDDAEWDSAVVVEADTLRGWLADAMPKAKADQDAPAKFLDRIELRSGLMVKRTSSQFAFTHLSFQEYFAATYLFEWITSDEWREGEGIPPGTSAADLKDYAREADWQEVLVFLFELLGEQKPLRKKRVREAVFGEKWEAVTAAQANTSRFAELVAKLTVNPHVGWDEEARNAGLQEAINWSVRSQQERSEEYTGDSVFMIALDGESDVVATRLGVVAEIARQHSAITLNLTDTAVADLEPLAGLTGLEELTLANTKVGSLTPLAGLTHLKLLDVSETAVADLEPLACLTGLEELTLSNTNVATLASLAGLTQLKVLNLSDTLVADLEPLAGLTGLKELVLQNTAVEGLYPLAGLCQLEQLYLYNTKVENLLPIAGLSQLKTLSLSCTAVTHLNAIAGMTELQALYLYETKVENLIPLTGLSQLNTLNLSSTAVSNLEPIANLTQLEWLHLIGTQVPPEQISELRAKLPKCEIEG